MTVSAILKIMKINSSETQDYSSKTSGASCHLMHGRFGIDPI